ncbi:MAG: DUF2971 domain-containing protein [Verrucomicrobiota bacterium]
MRLYRFLDEFGGLQTIESGKLKVSRLADLNDPFEWWLGIDGIVQEGKAFAEYQSGKFVEGRNEHHGLLCFSGTAKESVLWSHYADRHRGMVLEIEVTDDPDKLIKVDYSDDRPCMDLTRWTTEKQDYGFPLINQLIRRKSCGWAYENEYRLYLSLAGCEIARGLYFRRLNTGMLHRLIIGWKSRIEISYVQRLLNQSGYKDCKVARAHPQDRSYLIAYDGDDEIPVSGSIRLGDDN